MLKTFIKLCGEVIWFMIGWFAVPSLVLTLVLVCLWKLHFTLEQCIQWFMLFSTLGVSLFALQTIFLVKKGE